MVTVADALFTASRKASSTVLEIPTEEASVKHKAKLFLLACAAFSLCFALSGCVSAEARDAMSAIDAIGEVTVGSCEAVEDANAKYDALSDEDKQKVDNYATLEEANSRLAEILYAEIAKELEAAEELGESYFAQYYDTNGLNEAKANAQAAISNSESGSYGAVYKALSSEIESFEGYIAQEIAQSCSQQTNDGEYPFSVEESVIQYSYCLAPIVKHSSAYPVNPCFIDAETTDGTPVFDFQVGDNSCTYGYGIEQVDTIGIDVQDENGDLKRAFVNTRVDLFAPPESWSYNPDVYPLDDNPCYLFSSADYGTTLAIPDLAGGEGYILFHYTSLFS